MKRTWTIFTLIFTGLIACSNLRAESLPSTMPDASFTMAQLQKLTEVEMQILQKASPVLGIPMQELVALYEDGDATIEHLSNGQYRVKAYVNSGNPIEAIIESSF